MEYPEAELDKKEKHDPPDKRGQFCMRGNFVLNTIKNMPYNERVHERHNARYEKEDGVKDEGLFSLT